MEALSIVILIATSFVAGIFIILAYMISRMLSSDGWDKSNIMNALRVLSHVVMHPNDLTEMYYITPDQRDEIATKFPAMIVVKPFWYIDKDEFEGVVKTRPK